MLHTLHRLRRFPWLGIRVGFFLGSLAGRPFYKLRGLMLTVDFLLTAVRLCAWVGTPISAYLFFFHGLLAPFITCFILDVLFFVLRKQEARERFSQRLKPIDLYNINVGTGKTLSGDIYVGHLFLGDLSFWTDEEKHDSLGTVKEATSWLEQQAKNYGVELTFHHHLLGRVGSPLSQLPESSNKYSEFDEFSEVVQDAFSRCGLLRDSYRADGVVAFVHTTEYIRSFAVSENIIGGSPHLCRERVEFAVIALDAHPAVYAHELLHLFGADDFYRAMSADEMIEKEAFLSRSIMFTTGSPIERLTIDGTTAQNIGWL